MPTNTNAKRSFEPRRCSSCSDLIDKAVRVHLGRSFCRRCYDAYFWPVSCATCKASMRAFHLEMEEATCDACQRADRVCLRCERPTPVAAKIVDGKAVCKSCVRFFSELRKCGRCGGLSRCVRMASPEAPSGSEHPAQYPADENEGSPLCQPCRNKATHATCSVCRKYRRVEARDVQSKPLCAACAAPAPVTHACPTCGDRVAGSGQGRCLPCTLKDAAMRRADEARLSLGQDWCRELWDAFVHQLTQTPGQLSKASARITASLQYFKQIDSKFASREDVTGASLHEEIDSPTHRRNLLAYRFLLRKVDAAGAADAREESNEARRLGDVLARASGSTYAEILAGYVKALQAAGMNPKSTRLYAGVAQSFCEHGNVHATRAWAPSAVLDFLMGTPGAANSLSRFVTYCRTVLGWEVAMPSKASREAARAASTRSGMGPDPFRGEAMPPVAQSAAVNQT